MARVGDGAASCQGGCGVFFDEVVTNPQLGVAGSVSAMVGPITASAGGRRCALTNSYPRDGWIQSSADGRSIVVLCMDVAFNNAAAGWPGTAASTYKTLALVGADGIANTATAGLNAFQAGNYYLHTAATVNGSGFWAIGSSSTGCDTYAGIQYIARGGTSFTALDTGLGNCNYDSRYVSIYKGQLYGVFTDTGKRGVYKMGTGLPTTTSAPGTLGTLLPGFADYQTQMAGSNPNELAGFLFQNDTSLWIIDNAAVASAHVWQWTSNGTRWSRAASILFATSDLAMSITGRVEQSGFAVYVVTYVSGGLGQLWRFDTVARTGNTAPLAINPTANTMWRSVLLPPVDVTMFPLTPSTSPSNTVTSSATGTLTSSTSNTR